jgi:predicted O-methyltransferase YrrM
MTKELWSAVDEYLNAHLIPNDPILDAALKSNTAADLPTIDVTPTQGKLLHFLARIQGAHRILEMGTLGAYSTIWLARALPADGKLITLEVSAKHAQVALANIERAGLSTIVELRQGAALDSLAQLQKEAVPPFDLIFIDADKENNAVYLEWALRLSRPGTIIVVDNVIRDGAIIHPEDTDPRVQGSRRLFEKIAADPRLDATALQIVGSKGYDGLALAIVKSIP